MPGCSTAEVTVVVGGQWGNEGKGKLVASLSRSADVCARFNGGANNIHTMTIQCDGYASVGRRSSQAGFDPTRSSSELLLRIFPLGVLNKACKLVFGNGMMIHLPTLLDELHSVERMYDANVRERIFISNRAHVVFDFHKRMDTAFDDLRESKLGTTLRGVGPAYSTKTIRNGIRIGDLFSEDKSVLRDKVAELVSYFARYNTGLSVDVDQVVSDTLSQFDSIRDRVFDTVELMSEFLHTPGCKIVCEGSNSVMSDIDFGTYPQVTSSNTTPGAACTGLGIPPTSLTEVIGVIKPYTTRAQHWFPSVLDPSEPVSQHIISRGHEFGTTNSLSRRVGWLDLVQVKYAHSVSGFDSLMVSKLDALSGLEKIGIVTSYSNVNVEEKGYPSTPEEFQRVSLAEIEYLPGWGVDQMGDSRNFSDIPQNAKRLIQRIEEYIGVPVEFLQLTTQTELLKR